MIKTSSIEFLKEIFKIFIDNDVVAIVDSAQHATWRTCTCECEYGNCKRCDDCGEIDAGNFNYENFHYEICRDRDKEFLKLKLNENYLIDDISFLDLINFDKITIDLSGAKFGDGVLFQLWRNIKRKYYQCDIKIPAGETCSNSQTKMCELKKVASVVKNTDIILCCDEIKVDN
jgi:hypothetical protein